MEGEWRRGTQVVRIVRVSEWPRERAEHFLDHKWTGPFGVDVEHTSEVKFC